MYLLNETFIFYLNLIQVRISIEGLQRDQGSSTIYSYGQDRAYLAHLDTTPSDYHNGRATTANGQKATSYGPAFLNTNGNHRSMSAQLNSSTNSYKRDRGTSPNLNASPNGGLNASPNGGLNASTSSNKIYKRPAVNTSARDQRKIQVVYSERLGCCVLPPPPHLKCFQHHYF